MPVPDQDILLESREGLSSDEYLELLRNAVRTHRAGKQVERSKGKKATEATYRPWREVYNEYLIPTVAATVLAHKNAKTSLEGWNACTEWVSSMDDPTKAARIARKDRDIALEKKRSELRNQEFLTRRTNNE